MNYFLLFSVTFRSSLDRKMDRQTESDAYESTMQFDWWHWWILMSTKIYPTVCVIKNNDASSQVWSTSHYKNLMTCFRMTLLYNYKCCVTLVPCCIHVWRHQDLAASFPVCLASFWVGWPPDVASDAPRLRGEEECESLKITGRVLLYIVPQMKLDVDMNPSANITTFRLGLSLSLTVAEIWIFF